MSAKDAGKQSPPEFPYPKPRPGQLEVARAVAETVRRGEALLLSAPTGFGKTVAVLYGLLQAGVERVLYLVRTRNEIEPVLRELRRLGVRKTSFLYSARRMCPLLRGEGLSTEDFWETCRLLRLRGVCLYYNNYVEASEDTVKELVYNAGDWEPKRVIETIAATGLCPFFSLRLAALDSTFIVATYPYLFRKDIFSSVFEPLTYSDFVIVVDEAHSLLNIQSMFEVTLGKEAILAAQREAERYGLPSELSKSLERLLEILEKAPAPGDGYRRLEKKLITQVLGEPQVWIDAAQEVRAAKIRERIEEGGDARLSVAMTRIAVFAEAVAADNTGVYVKYDGRKLLAVIPIEPSSIVSKPLNEARAVVLLSGTMPPSSLVKSVLAIEKPVRIYEVELVHGLVFPRENLKVLLLLDVTSRGRERSIEMYRRYADYVAATFECVRKAVMIIYPSYEFMRNIVKLLEEKLGEYMIVEGRNTSIEDVKAEVLRRQHVLINAVAGGKLAEGVEFTQEGRSLLSTVFIAGVPYPRPDDYVDDMYASLARRMGEAEAREFIYDYMAAIRVRQAVGRARRSPEDRALVVLGDSRFYRRKLRSYLKLRIDDIVSSLTEYKARVCGYARQLNF